MDDQKVGSCDEDHEYNPEACLLRLSVHMVVFMTGDQ